MRVSREHVAENRRAILEAASRLFRERGYESVTVAEVMKVAGLTHGGFYGYFASKEQLIAAALADVFSKRPEPSGDLASYAAGYLSAWAAFSLGATALQRLLAKLVFVSSMMEVTSPVLGATLLFVAGVYQLTPFKHACLRTCRSPLGFLMSRWRPGLAGAFRMGLEHGVLCVGCCWALMLLLFAGGVMNLAVIGALTALVAFEKLTVLGAQGARISGVLLIASAFWLLVR